MQKRKGFTLVELVIVIAVIAILAGVLIGTFASVINKANESAKMQELKAAEHEQKANDLLKKIEDSNWYGWEDFETSIVAKLEKTFEQHSSSGATTEQIKATLVEALNEYAKNHTTDNTSLTEEQVKAIVENAVGTLKFEGVTEAQVRAIVNEATSRTAATQLSAAQVKAIVNAANENNVTAAQVAQIVAQKMSELDNKYSASETEIKNKIDSVVASITSATLTEEQVAQIVENLLPVTVHVSSASELEAKAQTLNSFSTIFVDTAISDPVTISTTDTKTLIIKGAALNEVTINAPKATIYLVSDASQVIVQEIAQNSFHVAGTVQSLVVKAGRAVVESSGSVNTLTAAPAREKTVKVFIEETAIVSHLVAEYQKNGNGTNDWIEVENNGTVGEAKLVVVAGNDTNTDVTTNVKVTNGAKAVGTNVEKVKVDTTAVSTEVTLYVADDNNVVGTVYEKAAGSENIVESVKNYYWGNNSAYATSFAGGDGTSTDPYQISNAAELARLAYLVNNDGKTFEGEYFALTADINLEGGAWMPISAFPRSLKSPTIDKYFAGNFDGNNYTISGLSDKEATIYDSQTMTNDSTPFDGAEYVYGLFGAINGATIKNVKLSNVSIKFGLGTEEKDGTNKRYISDSVGALVGYATGSILVENCHTLSGVVQAYDGAAGIVGKMHDSGAANTDDDLMVIKDCSNAATINSVRRAAGIVGNIRGTQAGEKENIGMYVTNCSNSGNITTAFIEDYDAEADTSNYYAAAGIGNVNRYWYKPGNVSYTNHCYDESPTFESCRNTGTISNDKNDYNFQIGGGNN